MRQNLEDITITPDADALDALSRMQRTGSSRLLVTDGDRLKGLLSLKDLLRFLNLKLELEGFREPPTPPDDRRRRTRDELVSTRN